MTKNYLMALAIFSTTLLSLEGAIAGDTPAQCYGKCYVDHLHKKPVVIERDKSASAMYDTKVSGVCTKQCNFTPKK